jgi:hypothetical protein
MARCEQTQFNVRSAFARRRAHELARKTGLSVTQIVEEALRAYVPPAAVVPVGKLVQRGPILVVPAATASRITLEEVNDALSATREHGG